MRRRLYRAARNNNLSRKAVRDFSVVRHMSTEDLKDITKSKRMKMVVDENLIGSNSRWLTSLGMAPAIIGSTAMVAGLPTAPVTMAPLAAALAPWIGMHHLLDMRDVSKLQRLNHAVTTELRRRAAKKTLLAGGVLGTAGVSAALLGKPEKDSDNKEVEK